MVVEGPTFLGSEAYMESRRISNQLVYRGAVIF
jgi:hypothetical protein